MKKIKYLFWAILLMGVVSCSDETPVPSNNDTILTEDVTFELEGEIKSIGLKEHYETIIQEASAGNDEESAIWLAYAQAQLDTLELMEKEYINQAGANWDVNADGGGNNNRLLGYEYATLRYKSIDHNGKDVMLSTLVVWPFNNIIPDPDANNVIIGCHVTIGSNDERPTNYSKNSIGTDVGMLASCAISYLPGKVYENLVIIPDYQGYGATHGEIHPYLSQDLTARQVLDGVRAGIKFYKEHLKHKLEDDWTSLSTGYSQGGSVAMAVQRYVEKNNLTDEFNYKGSVCGSGPYDPVATLEKYISTDQLYMPVAAAMMMNSMCKTNPRLMGKYTPADFLTDAAMESGIIDMIDFKKKNTDEVNEALLKYSLEFNLADTDKLCMYRKAKDGFYPYRKDTKDNYQWESGNKTSYAKTSDVIRPEVINWMIGKQDPAHKDKMEALVGALKDNVLYTDWTPATSTFLFHSPGDEIVPFVNYENCLAAWKGSDKVKAFRCKGLSQSHIAYGKVFYVNDISTGIRAIFGNKTHNYKFEQTLGGI